MLTVKLIESNGYEQVRQAHIVERSFSDDLGRYEIIAYDNEDAEGRTIFGREGVVYVMNDKGQTVAKYDLSHMGSPALKETSPALA